MHEPCGAISPARSKCSFTSNGWRAGGGGCNRLRKSRVLRATPIRSTNSIALSKKGPTRTRADLSKSRAARTSHHDSRLSISESRDVEQAIILILGLLVAVLLADGVRNFFRMRALQERTNQVCGLGEQPGEGAPPGGVDSEFAPLLEKWGFARSNGAVGTYVVLAPVALALTVASLGWKSGFAAAVVV